MAEVFDYGESVADARELLEEFGQTGTITRTTMSGGSPSTGGGTTTTTDYPALMALFPVDARDVDGTMIKAGDWTVYVEPLDIAPTTTDTITCSEGTLTIVNPKRIAPSGVTVLWEITARKG